MTGLRNNTLLNMNEHLLLFKHFTVMTISQDAPKVLAGTFVCVCRVINVWNSLPNTVCFNSQASFKRSLKGINFSEFIKCY